MLLTDICDTIAGNFDRQLDTEFRRRTEDLVILARAELIRRNIDKYGSSSSNLIQQVNCIPTIQVDVSECCSVDLGCNVTRTKDVVPKPIRTRTTGSNFMYIGTIDGKHSYSFMDAEDIDLFKGERFFKPPVGYSYVNGYIYIHGDNPQNIRVKGIFGDPREVINLNDCDGDGDCIDDFNIDEDLGTLIIDFVTNQLRMTKYKDDQLEVNLEDNN